MKLYTGIDLHSNNSYVVVSDESGKPIYQKRLSNDLPLLLKELSPYQDRVDSIAVESTYNWYWMVDGLKEAGYQVRLANTTAINQYAGLKHTDDKSDAIWLANLLRLGLLAEGHIYPKEERGVRELLRRRTVLVRQQTMNLLGIQGMFSRYQGFRISAEKIRQQEEEEKLLALLSDKDARLGAEVQFKVLQCLIEQISVLEKAILLKIKENTRFKLLKSIPGIGPILAMTILLETGEISRFKEVGNYSSYCRCVESKRISNGKKKGENNRRNGNKYLGWAFVEAANFAIRFNETIKRYYQRKMAKTKRVIALKTVAHKLARACYFILRDEVEFDIKKAFC